VRIAVWSPGAASGSGIADYVAEQLPLLRRHADVICVDESGASQAAAARADLHVYHLGNSPAHAFVYRAALREPGVVVLHEWSLHHLVLCETVERGDTARYLREMRRAHGPVGSYVGRQVARALGGDLLPALFPLNDRILEASLGVVGLTQRVARHAAARLPGRPVLHLPHHVCVPIEPVPSRVEARRQLGLPEQARIVTAPGLATASKRLDVAIRVLGRLRARMPSLRMVVAGAVDPRLPLDAWAAEAGVADRLSVTGRLSLEDFVRHLAAADVVLALRFPTHGEISGALLRALGVGRCTMVTAGTPASEEFPDGVVVPVEPGRCEAAALEALLVQLLEDDRLRGAIERLAREHVRRRHELADTVARLARFLDEVRRRKREILERLTEDRAEEGSLLGYLMEEVRWGARELGLPGVHLGMRPLIEELIRA
jgi:glycosyltransferase involved in cell wall biosynthesis